MERLSLPLLKPETKTILFPALLALTILKSSYKMLYKKTEKMGLCER